MNTIRKTIKGTVAGLGVLYLSSVGGLYANAHNTEHDSNNYQQLHEKVENLEARLDSLESPSPATTWNRNPTAADVVVGVIAMAVLAYAVMGSSHPDNLWRNLGSQ